MKYTHDEWIEILNKNPWKLSVVPEDMINYQLLDKAIEKDGNVIEILKHRNLFHLIPDDLLELAVQTNGSALSIIPHNKKTERMCVNAISGTYGSGDNLEFVPLNFRKYDLCKLALDSCPESIYNIPVDIMDKRMAIIAVESGIKMREIPTELYSDELFDIGITKDYETLSFIPAEKLKRDFCLKAVKFFGEAFNFVPKDMINQEFIDIINTHKGRLLFVPEKI